MYILGQNLDKPSIVRRKPGVFNIGGRANAHALLQISVHDQHELREQNLSWSLALGLRHIKLRQARSNVEHQFLESPLPAPFFESHFVDLIWAAQRHPASRIYA